MEKEEIKMLKKKIITLKLSKKELKVLLSIIDENPCRVGCVWQECYQKYSKIKDENEQYNYCDKCSFTQNQESLSDKLSKVGEMYGITSE